MNDLPDGKLPDAFVGQQYAANIIVIGAIQPIHAVITSVNGDIGWITQPLLVTPPTPIAGSPGIFKSMVMLAGMPTTTGMVKLILDMQDSTGKTLARKRYHFEINECRPGLTGTGFTPRAAYWDETVYPVTAWQIQPPMRLSGGPLNDMVWRFRIEAKGLNYTTQVILAERLPDYYPYVFSGETPDPPPYAPPADDDVKPNDFFNLSPPNVGIIENDIVQTADGGYIKTNAGGHAFAEPDPSGVGSFFGSVTNLRGTLRVKAVNADNSYLYTGDIVNNGGIIVREAPVPLKHPRIFVFSDKTTAVAWNEQDSLMLTAVSIDGNNTPSFLDPIVVTTGMNSDIPPAVIGDVGGNIFYIVFTDGISFGFQQFDKQLNRSPIVVGITSSGDTLLSLAGSGKPPIFRPFFNMAPNIDGIETQGERIDAISASYSTYDDSLTVALSVIANQISYVTLQRFDNLGRPLTQRFVVDHARFGRLATPALTEFHDGSLILTYCTDDNMAVLRRFDREINPIGTGDVVEHFNSPDFLSVAQIGPAASPRIVWGYHVPANRPDNSGLGLIYKYDIDCPIKPSLRSVSPPCCLVKPCRTI